MRAAMHDADARGALLGTMPLAPLLPPMSALAGTLSPNRTPNILARAVAQAAAAEQQQGEEADAGLFTITRHGNTQRIPWSWLRLGVAFRCGVK